MVAFTPTAMCLIVYRKDGIVIKNFHLPPEYGMIKSRSLMLQNKSMRGIYK